jgi:8-oxo-dGTP diphosphatase
MSYFNVRVYGILINENKQVLVSDEYIRGGFYTKFTGGGLEFGEGLRDGLIREWKEELHANIEVLEHLYTTDFFQISAFDQMSQIISVYYRVQLKEALAVPLLAKPFDFEVPVGATEVEGVRWIDWDQFSAESVTLPIDKIVADLVKAHTFPPAE